MIIQVTSSWIVLSIVFTTSVVHSNVVGLEARAHDKLEARAQA